MFEALIVRVERRAARRAGELAHRVAEELAGSLPDRVSAAADDKGVGLSGPALARRFALDPALRWLIAGTLRP